MRNLALLCLPKQFKPYSMPRPLFKEFPSNSNEMQGSNELLKLIREKSGPGMARLK
jgi:hypothetical protein